MENIHFIKDVSEIKLSSRWVDSKKFDSKCLIVDENGKLPSHDYTGRRYRLIGKKEKQLNGGERLGRGFLAIIVTITSLGLALISKSVRLLLTLDKFKVRYAIKLKPIDIKDQTLVLSDDVVEKVRSVIANKEDDGVTLENDGVTFYDSGENHLVFELKSVPGIIFKKKRSLLTYWGGREDHMAARYRGIQHGQYVCKEYGLDKLKIPKSVLIRLGSNDEQNDPILTDCILAQEKVDIDHNVGTQEDYYQNHGESLDEAIRQLAIFICQTGFFDVDWKNIPVLNIGSGKIALIDLESLECNLKPPQKFEPKEIGIFGGVPNPKGLVRCINDEQVKLVVKIAKKFGVSTQKYKKAMERKQEERLKNTPIKEFHKKHNIITGKEPIEVDDLNSLLLDLNELDIQGDTTSEEIQYDWNDFLKDIINLMNHHFQTIWNPGTPIEKRQPEIYLESFIREKLHKDSSNTNEKYALLLKGKLKLWLPKILQALVDKGHIFEATKMDEYSYFIQA